MSTILMLNFPQLFQSVLRNVEHCIPPTKKLSYATLATACGTRLRTENVLFLKTYTMPLAIWPDTVHHTHRDKAADLYQEALRTHIRTYVRT